MTESSGESALARSFKALSDPSRLRLLSLVAAHDGGEATVVDLTEPLGLSQPTVSHHLKILVEAGLLTREKRSVWSYYALVPGALGTCETQTPPGRLPRTAEPPGTGLSSAARG